MILDNYLPIIIVYSKINRYTSITNYITLRGQCQPAHIQSFILSKTKIKNVITHYLVFKVILPTDLFHNIML